jgi:hypothetical protein
MGQQKIRGLFNDSYRIAYRVDTPEDELTIFKRNDMFKNNGQKLSMNG